MFGTPEWIVWVILYLAVAYGFFRAFLGSIDRPEAQYTIQKHGPEATATAMIVASLLWPILVVLIWLEGRKEE